MSSEKRSIRPNTFDREVPPLKTILSLKLGSAKSCLSTQQTQKSFSITAGLMPRLAADSRKSSLRSAAVSRATLSIWGNQRRPGRSFPADLLDRGVDPSGGGLRVGQDFFTQGRVQPEADLRRNLRRDPLLAERL